MTVFN